MKTLRDYIVNGALYQGDTGPEAQVGDQIKLFLDTEADPGFPEFILGVIQHPIVKVQCGAATSYVVEYDEVDLLGAAALIRPGDVVDATIVSAVDGLAAALDAEELARVAADDAINDILSAATDANLEDTLVLRDGTGGFRAQEVEVVTLIADSVQPQAIFFDDGAGNTVTIGGGAGGIRAFDFPSANGTYFAATDRVDGIPELVLPPASDPGIAGVIWNNAGTLVISAG